MNRKHVRAARILAAAALLPALQGCVAVVAAVAAIGYVQYDRNELEQELELPFETTWQGVLAALDELGYPQERLETVGATERTLEVEGVWIRVDKQVGDHSRLRVRVGTFASADNARRARLVTEAIHHQLGLEPPAFDEVEAPEPERDISG